MTLVQKNFEQSICKKSYILAGKLSKGGFPIFAETSRNELASTC